MCVLPLTLGCQFAVDLFHRERLAGLGEVMVCLVLIIVGIVAILYSSTRAVALSDDAVVIGSVFGGRRVPVNGIRGRRGGVGSFRPRYVNLETDDDSDRIIGLARCAYNFDLAFYEWYNALPDLDALDRTSSKFGLV